MVRVPPMICKPHRVPECPQCMKGKKMAGKCEHGLTTAECFVCASPKYGAQPDRPEWLRSVCRYISDTLATGTPNERTVARTIMHMLPLDQDCSVQVSAKAPLSEFKRMQIIGDEFPLALVEPIVIAKVDSVCLAIEKAHGIGA